MTERFAAPVSDHPPSARRTSILVLALCLAWAPWLVAPPDARAEEEAPSAKAASSAPAADARLAFTDGVLAFHDQDWETARQRFEEAVRLAPEDGTARYWLGVTDLNLGRPADAAREIEASLRARLPPRADPAEVRSRLAEARERAGRAAGEEAVAGEMAEVALQRVAVPAPTWSGGFAVLPETPRFDGRLSLGVGTDSNPYLMPDDLVLVTPGGTVLDGAESDTVLLADVRLAGQWVDEAAGRTAGVVVRGGQSAHDQFDELDLGRLEVVGQVALGKDPLGYLTGPLGYARVPLGLTRWSFLGQVGVSKDWLDGEGFADRRTGAVTVALNENGTDTLAGQTRLSISSRDTDFDADPGGAAGKILDRGGEEVGATIAQVLFFGRRNRYLRLGVGTFDRNAGSAYDASSLVADGELSLPVASRVTVYLSGAWRTDDYDEPVSNPFDPAGEPRQDDELRLGGAVVVRALARLFVSGRVTWIDHQIDLPAGFATPDLSYDRTVATVGLSWIF